MSSRSRLEATGKLLSPSSFLTVEHDLPPLQLVSPEEHRQTK